MKFSGGFKPLPRINLSVPKLIPTVFDGVFPSFQGSTYDTSGYTFLDNGLTIQKSSASMNHAFVNTNIYNDRRYVEWRINDATALLRMGYGNTISGYDNGQRSAASTSLPGVWLAKDGTVYTGSTTNIGKVFPTLKNGDIVGMAIDARGLSGNSIKVNFHVNGYWGPNITQAQVSDTSAWTVSASGIIGSITPMIQATDNPSMNITLNAGQLSTPYAPDNYRFMGYRDHKVRLLAGFGGQQINDNRVRLSGTTASSSFRRSAYSSMPMPNQCNIYFELTAHNVATTEARFGTRFYRRPADQNLGGPNDTRESGISALNGGLYTLNNTVLNKNGFRGTTVNSSTPKTWGIAMKTPQYYLNEWYIRDAQGWMGTPNSNGLGVDWDPYGNNNLETYFCVCEGPGSTLSEWSLNTGDSPFLYSVPTGFQTWNDVMATRTSYSR